MPEPSRRAVRAAAWGVIAVILGTAAVATWYSSPRLGRDGWLAWVLSALATAAVYLCFDPLGLWPIRRWATFDLIPEIVDNQVRFDLTSSSPTTVSAQVTSLCQPPRGRPKGPQHWPMQWHDDGTVESKRILSGQTRTLDFAIFDPEAVMAPSDGGRGGAAHWRFASAPEPIGVKYYNLLSPADADEQEFILTVRILIADSRRYLDWQVTVKAIGFEVVCECVPIKRARYFPLRRRAASNESWSARTHQASS